MYVCVCVNKHLVYDVTHAKRSPPSHKMRWAARILATQPMPGPLVHLQDYGSIYRSRDGI